MQRFEISPCLTDRNTIIMKKTLLLILAAVGLFAIESCNKHEVVPPPETTPESSIQDRVNDQLGDQIQLFSVSASFRFYKRSRSSCPVIK